MPDLREVFEMVQQQTEPDLDSWSEQERRMRQVARRRKAGALVLVAALILALAVLVVRNLDDPGTGAATNPPTSAPASPLPIVGLASVDIPTGAMTDLGIVPTGSAIDVSPDATQITYTDTNGSSKSLVWIANADGSDQHAFNGTDGAATPRWSPDGSKIVYQAYANEGESDERIGNLYVLDISTGRTTRITDLEQGTPGLYHGLDALTPTFTADGASVLFSMPSGIAPVGERLDDGWDIWSVPANGGEPTLVMQNAFGPDVLADGTIAFTAVRYDNGGPLFGGLYVADAGDGSPDKVVGGSTLLPRWSPDGTQIAYEDLGHHNASIVDVATGQERVLRGIDGWPEWVNGHTIVMDQSG
jgi:Tol biopolymer transport system component